MSNGTGTPSDHDTSFGLAIRARDARTSATLAFVGTVPTVFVAMHWHVLVFLPALALALLVSSLYRLARVAGDHTRFEQRHQRDATSET